MLITRRTTHIPMLNKVAHTLNSNSWRFFHESLHYHPTLSISANCEKQESFQEAMA